MKEMETKHKEAEEKSKKGNKIFDKVRQVFRENDIIINNDI